MKFRSIVRPSLVTSAAFCLFLGCGSRSDTKATETPTIAAPAAAPLPVAANETTPGGGAAVGGLTGGAPSAPATPPVPAPGNPPRPTPVVPPAAPSTPPAVPPTPSPAVGIDWVFVSTTFFQPNCVRCHSAPGNAGDLNLETYASVKASLASIQNRVLVEKTMPPRKLLPSTTTDILKAWLDAGAPETL